jgi:hypothetical protein
VFIKTVSDEEADKEYRRLYPNAAAAGDDRELVCDDCFNAMQAEYPAEQYEADHAVMRDNP